MDACSAPVLPNGVMKTRDELDPMSTNICWGVVDDTRAQNAMPRPTPIVFVPLGNVIGFKSPYTVPPSKSRAPPCSDENKGRPMTVPAHALGLPDASDAPDDADIGNQ